jgi:hypothetical protein
MQRVILRNATLKLLVEAGGLSLRLVSRHLRNHMMITWWARDTVYWLNLKGLVYGSVMAKTDMYWSLLKLANTLGKL